MTVEAEATLKGAGAQAEAKKETSTLDTHTESGDNDQAQLNSGADDEHRPTFQPSNPPTLQLTPDHPIYVEGKGWLWAENLALGDRLRRSDGGWAKVLAVERVNLAEPQPVYNFTVKGPHTYFVLEVGVLVHNAGCGPDGHGLLERYKRSQWKQAGYDIENPTIQHLIEKGQYPRGLAKNLADSAVAREASRFRQWAKWTEGNRSEFLIHFTDEVGYNRIRNLVDNKIRFRMKPSVQEMSASRGVYFIDAEPIEAHLVNMFVPKFDPNTGRQKGSITHFIAIDPKLVELLPGTPKHGKANLSLPFFDIHPPSAKLLAKAKPLIHQLNGWEARQLIGMSRFEWILPVPEPNEFIDVTDAVVGHGRIDDFKDSLFIAD